MYERLFSNRHCTETKRNNGALCSNPRKHWSGYWPLLLALPECGWDAPSRRLSWVFYWERTDLETVTQNAQFSYEPVTRNNCKTLYSLVTFYETLKCMITCHRKLSNVPVELLWSLNTLDMRVKKNVIWSWRCRCYNSIYIFFHNYDTLKEWFQISKLYLEALFAVYRTRYCV